MNGPGHPEQRLNFPRTPAEKEPRPVLKAIFLGLLGLFLVAEVLSFTTFCYADKRFHDDAYFLSAAVDSEIKLTRAHYPTAVRYESVSNFLSKNPDCCTVSRWKGRYKESEILGRMFFFYPNVYVYLKYRRNDVSKDWDFDSYFILDAYGTILERYAGSRA